ncbi:MAG: ASKHA domain-containing protein [Bryobacteraceae bacterium]
MTGVHRVHLIPLGVHFEVEHGATLETVLPAFGVEFPCGGAGVCRGCRVRVLEGALAVTREMEEVFTPEEIAAGWRLACRGRVEGPLALEIAQWSAPVLADDSRFPFEPAEGCGIAIDLGTTTLVAQMVDLATGETLAVETALNPQAAWGADVMSRVQFALEGGAGRLASAIRAALGALIAAMPRRDSVRLAMLAGNTVMHHLFCGLDVAGLAQAPFQTAAGGERTLAPRELGWDLPDDATVRFLPCLGGFVGSDILAGILATGIAESAELAALIDLGTNGEIAIGNAEKILCASTAAGPAFEAGRIRMGMRASTGAIAHVAARNGSLECRVIGGSAARGVCGSGLVDAAAAGLEMGSILPNGRLANGAREFPLLEAVTLTQADFRELQLAKGAIASGVRILAERRGASLSDLRRIYLAGAFGNYVDIASARRIGLIEAEAERIFPAGNASLRGVKMALLSPSRRDAWIAGVRARTEHVPLAADPKFQETFVECLPFPRSSLEVGRL